MTLPVARSGPGGATRRPGRLLASLALACAALAGTAPGTAGAQGPEPARRPGPAFTSQRVPDMTVTDHRWSGYSVQGRGFTSVHGTFNVPSLGDGAATRAGPGALIEWVGIDGWYNSYLVQAGVVVSRKPLCTKGPAVPGRTYACAWTFLIEDNKMSPGPGPDLSIVPGDKVAVAITKVATGQWLITMADKTSGQVWSKKVAYTGPQETAEWVLESPPPVGSCTLATDCQIFPLVPYTGTVRFSGTSCSGAAIFALYRITFAYGGTVSSPSALAPGTRPLGQGFTLHWSSN